jgi:hypothetical protein
MLQPLNSHIIRSLNYYNCITFNYNNCFGMPDSNA